MNYLLLGKNNKDNKKPKCIMEIGNPNWDLNATDTAKNIICIRKLLCDTERDTIREYMFHH